MRLYYSFKTVKDMCDKVKGEELVAVFDKYELHISKAGSYEPVRLAFERDRMADYWCGTSSDGKFFDNYFLFKGTENFKFTGMASWNKGLPAGSRVLNSIFIVINYPAKADLSSTVSIGDDLFTWSKAEYGFISEMSRRIDISEIGNIFTTLPGLHWVNYFSSSYIDNPDFHLSDNRVWVSHGTRIQIASRPDDPLVDDVKYKNRMIEQIGLQWFWDGRRKVVLRTQDFNTSEISRKT